MVGAVVPQMVYGNRKIIHARRRIPAQRSARDEGWNKVIARHIPEVHPFIAQSGIMVDTDRYQPMDFYKLFISDDLLNSFVTYSNSYATRYIAQHSALLSKPRSRLNDWTPVSLNEMKQFIGLTLLMGLIKKHIHGALLVTQCIVSHTNIPCNYAT
jgi:hypothetical protein